MQNSDTVPNKFSTGELLAIRKNESKRLRYFHPLRSIEDGYRHVNNTAKVINGTKAVFLCLGSIELNRPYSMGYSDLSHSEREVCYLIAKSDCVFCYSKTFVETNFCSLKSYSHDAKETVV